MAYNLLNYSQPGITADLADALKNSRKSQLPIGKVDRTDILECRVIFVCGLGAGIACRGITQDNSKVPLNRVSIGREVFVLVSFKTVVDLSVGSGSEIQLVDEINTQSPQGSIETFYLTLPNCDCGSVKEFLGGNLYITSVNGVFL